MSDNDFAYMMEYEPDTVMSYCNALSVKLQKFKENESLRGRGKRGGRKWGA